MPHAFPEAHGTITYLPSSPPLPFTLPHCLPAMPAQPTHADLTTLLPAPRPWTTCHLQTGQPALPHTLALVGLQTSTYLLCLYYPWLKQCGGGGETCNTQFSLPACPMPVPALACLPPFWVTCGWVPCIPHPCLSYYTPCLAWFHACRNITFYACHALSQPILYTFPTTALWPDLLCLPACVLPAMPLPLLRSTFPPHACPGGTSPAPPPPTPPNCACLLPQLLAACHAFPLTLPFVQFCTLYPQPYLLVYPLLDLLLPCPLVPHTHLDRFCLLEDTLDYLCSLVLAFFGYCPDCQCCQPPTLPLCSIAVAWMPSAPPPSHPTHACPLPPYLALYLLPPCLCLPAHLPMAATHFLITCPTQPCGRSMPDPSPCTCLTPTPCYYLPLPCACLACPLRLLAETSVPGTPCACACCPRTTCPSLPLPMPAPACVPAGLPCPLYALFTGACPPWIYPPLGPLALLLYYCHRPYLFTTWDPRTTPLPSIGLCSYLGPSPCLPCLTCHTDHCVLPLWTIIYLALPLLFIGHTLLPNLCTLMPCPLSCLPACLPIWTHY